MRVLRRSMEQVAVALTLTMLGLICLSFALASQLQEVHEVRFLFSSVVLALGALYLRFGLHSISGLHRAGYRIAIVMMAWAIGLYFFPYPNAVIYLIIIPGFYFLYRIESKTESAPMEDISATGLLFLLAIFLYVQQQPLQTLLFDNLDFDWKIYYQNAPGMLMVGLALTRFQKWLQWDGIATIGTLIALIAATLSLSWLSGDRLAVSELFYFTALGHLLLALIFIANPIYQRFIQWSGVEHQSLDFSASIYGLVFTLGQLSLLILLTPFLPDGVINLSGLAWLNNLESTNLWLLATILLNITLPFYSYRHWSFSLLLLEISLVAVFLVMTKSLVYLEINVALAGLILVAGQLLAMVLLKRKRQTQHWVNNWGFIGVLAAYIVIFLHTPIFTPLGLLGFIFPLLAWAALPDRPVPIARRYEAYFWPLAAVTIVLCFNADKNFQLLSDWALLTIAAPVALTIAMSNNQLQQLIQQRGWTVLNLWQIEKQKYLLFYSLVSVIICVVSFLTNQTAFESSWFYTLITAIALVLSASAVLYVAINKKSLWLLLLTELILWLTLSLIRWKLESLELMQMGTPIDGYIFIVIAIVIAGIREKLRDNSQHLSRYFIKSSIVYSLIGWAYLVYLHLTGAEALHGEIASMIMAGIFYWLSRSSHKSLKILVFIFANLGLFLFFIDQEYNNLLVYFGPALGSALVLTQMFKDELSESKISQIRLYCGLILLGISAAYNILDFGASVWYPAVAAMTSAFVVLLGISLRIRIFLYLGSAFVLVNIIGMVANVIINQPPDKTMFAVGLLFLVTGVLFVASYLLFQMKREEIKQKYLDISGTLAKWE